MKTLVELSEIGKQTSGIVNKRNHHSEDKSFRSVMICGGTGCTSSDSMIIMEEFEKAAAAHGIEANVEVVRTGCFGLCELGPVVIVYPEGAFYSKVTVKDVEEITVQHLKDGNVVKNRLYPASIENDEIKALDEIPFFKKQVRKVLRNCGLIDPERIDEYLAVEGYKGLEKALKSMKPAEVIETVKQSGLRGRGGGGFPTGIKWEAAARQDKEHKAVVCNADEGDPGAFMDRSILEGDPHALIEAMILAGYAIGAREGYVYVRAEYPIAVQRLSLAIKQAREYGLLGKNIFDSGFDFDIDVRLGAGAFVCGEETALMNSIEGKRGMPNPKPPFPAQSGLWEMPTIINNVETFASVPQIILHGAEWLSSVGTEKSKGTKVFALGGKVVNTGLVEVPMGITLREVIYDIGGGIPNGKKFKAVQTGGPSGGCLTEEHLDKPIDYDTLLSLGSMMGSGGMIVMDEDNCMVDVARFYLDFTRDESCGKCVPCRVGTKRLLEILEKITKGQGTMEDLDTLEHLSHQIKAASLCGLGQTAPNPVLSTMKYFRDEYVAHIQDKKCPAGVCKDLLEYKITEEACTGCTICGRKCPVNAITGSLKSPHTIDQNVCIHCGVCYDVCKFNAITVG